MGSLQMKTEHRAHPRRYLALFLLFPVLVLATAGCNGSYGGGGGGGGNGTAPYVTTQPGNQTVALGQTATFSVTALGTAPLTYQWRKNGSNISGAISSSYTTPATTTVDNGEMFDVVISNSAGTVTSNSATLTVTTSTASAGWRFVQDVPWIFCNQQSPSSGCTLSVGQIAPTTAGSIWVLQVLTPTNVNMTGVTGGGGAWVHCLNCKVTNLCTAGVNGCPSTGGFTSDAWYNLSGNAGTTTGISFTMSASSTFTNTTFYEFLPPPGTTAIYDDSGTAAPVGCNPCTGVQLNNITGTDLVLQMQGGPAAWNSFSAPYSLTADGNGYALNVNAGSVPAPTVTMRGKSNPVFVAIAFKSSAGVFTPPPTQYSVSNFSALSASCNPNCTLTIPSTGAGHLLFMVAGNEAFNHINSVSGGGTWVVPTGSNTCQIQLNILSQNNAMSCAYVLSSTAGATSLSVTMSGNAQDNFAIWEVATNTTGVFALDAQASQTNAAGFYNNGTSLSLTGANDVVFQQEWCVGGSGGPTYYAMPYIVGSGSVGPSNYYFFNESSSVVLLDTGPTAPVPVWINPQNSPTFVTGVAFKTQ